MILYGVMVQDGSNAERDYRLQIAIVPPSVLLGIVPPSVLLGIVLSVLIVVCFLCAIVALPVMLAAAPA